MSSETRAIHAVADGQYRSGSSGVGPVDERLAALKRARQQYESIEDVVCAAWCAFDVGIIHATELADLKVAEAPLDKGTQSPSVSRCWLSGTGA